jgi:hypothetical protein
VLLLLASDQAVKEASGMVLESVGECAPEASIAEIIDCPLATQPALAACV